MMDLIGFWSGVTLITWVLLCCPLSALFFMAEVSVAWASRERVDVGCKLDRILGKIYPGDGFGFFIWFISCAMWVIYFIVLVCAAGDGVVINPVYELVAELAVWMTPVMSFIGTFVVVFGGGAIVMRKVFDMFFAVQDKLEKLK